jgi:putative polyhydroxyalkanoate system protein
MAGAILREARMATISIDRPHHLSQQKAKDLAERLARDLAQRFGLAWDWDGDDVRFRRPGVSGRMRVGETMLTLDVKLGLLLSPLKPTIEREIYAQLDRLAGGAQTA